MDFPVDPMIQSGPTPQHGHVLSPVAMKRGHEEGDASNLGTSEPPPKKKQKRNKPTLSCKECVERKTKVGCVCSVFLD